MAKGSSSRKVSRVASTGGGRTARGRIPWLWYGSLTLIAVLGVIGVYFSREDRLDTAETVAPRAPSDGQQGDHWHASIEFYVCDKALPPITDQTDPQGIHSHNDGVIHIHPFTRKAAGTNATLGKFADAVDLKLEKDSFQLPGDKKYETGDKCGEKKADVKYQVDGELFKGDPHDLLLKDNQLITVALVPEGVDIPDAPAERLQNLSDVPGATTTIPAETTETTAPGDTTVPGDTTATTAGGTTDTSAPGETSSTGESPETTVPTSTP